MLILNKNLQLGLRVKSVIIDTLEAEDPSNFFFRVVISKKPFDGISSADPKRQANGKLHKQRLKGAVVFLHFLLLFPRKVKSTDLYKTKGPLVRVALLRLS